MVFVDYVGLSFSSASFVSSQCSLILHGRRSIQLPKLRHLSVSVKPEEQNASSFSSSFSSAASAVDSLGLITKPAESISRKVRSERKGIPDSVLNLFKSYGFTDSQISRIIKDYPQVLRADAEKSIGPKLHYLESRGASTSELTEIVSTVPKILGKRVRKTISRYYDFIKDIIEADKSSNYEKLWQSLPDRGAQENKFRNVLVLRELGVPQKNLFSLLFSKSSCICGKEKFEQCLKKVVEMGIDPKTSNFVKALKVLYGMSDKVMEEKGFAVGDVRAMLKNHHPLFTGFSDKKVLNTYETFLELGFSRDEFLMMVKSVPQCIKYSTESVKKKTGFVVKKMNWPLEDVIFYPKVFGLSMEKRIVPRFNVIEALMSKGLLKGLPAMSSVLSCSDRGFLRMYVKKHDDKELVAELMSIFTRVSPDTNS